MNHTMKAIIIKSIMAALALVGLLLLGSARIMEKYIPEETV